MARFPKRQLMLHVTAEQRCHSCTYGCMSCSSRIEVCRKDAVFIMNMVWLKLRKVGVSDAASCGEGLSSEIIHIHSTDNPLS